MKIIAVTGFKGGIAKSTTAIHLATFLSKSTPTLLIDSDPNRTCEKWSDRGNRQQAFIVTNEKAASRHIPGKSYLVLDTPARPSSNELKEIAEGADLVIVPCLPDAFSLSVTLDMISELPSQCLYRVLLTICPPAPSKEAEQVREALTEAQIPLFTAQIRRSSGFTKAAALGVAIRDIPDSRGRIAWRDYEAVGREVISILRGHHG
ncbi:ParA family protein [Candidatus Synechococcus calcipolaris G9]|uniref:ParA family protein n=2 Tax=Candidatus Synechococcus calcipolaris G9 TaxID=1497997 RepID=A0ABT6F2B4_9SYNE|nr:ParA family protein [Candidatus Synechococcus calcipolaris]MDG2992010.1 ParA family protein [Candidatus Synechococcus calcipolaris G9]